MKTDWTKIKNAFVEGPVTTYPALAKKFKVNHDILKRHAAKEGWQEARKLFQNKVQSLRSEKKSEIMASESAQFDSECLNASRKGIQLINEVLAAIVTERPKDKGLKETIEWIEDRNDSIKELGKALNDFQKAGRLAFGENPDQNVAPAINVTVTTEKGKRLTEAIVKGKGTE